MSQILPGTQLSLSLHDAQQLIKALRTQQSHKFELFVPYPWQMECYEAGVGAKQRLVMAGNRVGKTLGLLFETAAHATGNYPDWWPGHKFNFAPTMWCCGVSGEQMRDVLQRTLLGDMDEKGQLSGGLIRANQIAQNSVVRDSGTPRLVKDIRIKHATGDATLISFKSYTQGPRPLMGTSIDFGLIDEQPPDDAYNQILTRTTLGNRGLGGFLLVGYTPELGVTEVLQEWMHNPKPGQWKRQVTWDDSPHMTPELQEQMLNATSESERDLRRLGLPIFGGGPVFTAPPESYTMEPQPVPSWWKVRAGIDFGLAHNFACIWTATNPETDEVWVYNEYISSNTLPAVHADGIRINGHRIPIAYPHDGHQREKDSGKTLAAIYREKNVNLAVQFTNEDGSLFVRPGLIKLNTAMANGKLKIFSTCRTLLREMQTYHYDTKGQPVAIHDDAISAFRYSTLMSGRLGIDFALAYDDTNYVWEYEDTAEIDY